MNPSQQQNSRKASPGWVARFRDGLFHRHPSGENSQSPQAGPFLKSEVTPELLAEYLGLKSYQVIEGLAGSGVCSASGQPLRESGLPQVFRCFRINEEQFEAFLAHHT